MAMRILIVEDDPVLADGLEQALTMGGYAVDLANTGLLADDILRYTEFDLVVLDIGLPKLSGFEVLQRLRTRGNKTPVLILTANDDVQQRVKGLDLGADDYLGKPFDLSELEARVRALIRRGQSGGGSQLILGGLRLDMASHSASYENVSLNLSARELAILEILMLKPQQWVDKQQILNRLCNFDAELSEDAIMVYLSRLRKKLSHTAIEIQTQRGLGYQIKWNAGPEIAHDSN